MSISSLHYPRSWRRPLRLAGLLAGLLPSLAGQAQAPTEALPTTATLPQCISYALRNQPGVRQALVDEAIGERTVRLGLAGWLPQINGTGTYVHNIQLPVSVLPNFANPTSGERQIVRVGLTNVSNLSVQGTQTIYNNDVWLAARSAREVRGQTRQNTTAVRIDVVTNVSKTFYDILLTQEQLRILDEAIQRLERQLKDARAQYEAGLVDRTDFTRAGITLKNTQAQRRTAAESLKGKYASLKQQVGAPPEQALTLAYDTTQMLTEAALDTNEALAYENRIEVQQLLTQQRLQHFSTDYYRYGFLPSLSGYGTYTRIYQNNELAKLYSQAFPTSQVGLQLNLPIFTGSRRLQNRKISELREERLGIELFDTKNQINTQYQQALAAYKGSYNEWTTQRENVADAKLIYGILKLQYDEGLKTYLEVLVAEADLRTAQLNALNALYTVLASKLDVQRALGTISVTP